MMKIRAGVLAIGAMASVGIAAAVVQTRPQADSGGVVRKVDRTRPATVSLSKRKRVATAVATRVPVVTSPAPAMMAAPAEPAPQPADVIPVAQVATCGCPVAGPGTSRPGVDDAAVDALVERICASLKTQAIDAAAERLEAEVVYVLDQSGAPKEIQLLALARFANYDCGPRNLPVALAGIDSAIRNRDVGTAALGGGGFAFPGASGFSSPALDVGGGSVNYAR